MSVEVCKILPQALLLLLPILLLLLLHVLVPPPSHFQIIPKHIHPPLPCPSTFPPHTSTHLCPLASTSSLHTSACLFQFHFLHTHLTTLAPTSTSAPHIHPSAPIVGTPRIYIILSSTPKVCDSLGLSLSLYIYIIRDILGLHLAIHLESPGCPESIHCHPSQKFWTAWVYTPPSTPKVWDALGLYITIRPESPGHPGSIYRHPPRKSGTP